MEVLSLIIRTGGVRELKHQVQALSSTTDSPRNRTDDALHWLEQLVRGKERPKPDEPSESPTR